MYDCRHDDHGRLVLVLTWLVVLSQETKRGEIFNDPGSRVDHFRSPQFDFKSLMRWHQNRAQISITNGNDRTHWPSLRIEGANILRDLPPSVLSFTTIVGLYE